jgi:hypothetical protein
VKDGTDFSTLTIASGNMMSETNSIQASSEATDASARKADVMPTASDQIAKWLAEVESQLALYGLNQDRYALGRCDGWRDDVTRLRAIMESINASSREEGIPTS